MKGWYLAVIKGQNNTEVGMWKHWRGTFCTKEQPWPGGLYGKYCLDWGHSMFWNLSKVKLAGNYDNVKIVGNYNNRYQVDDNNISLI